MTLSQHPSTHYRGRQDGFDISNTLSDSRKKKDLIDWGQDTARRQNINFLKSIVFVQEQMQAGSNKEVTYMNNLIISFWKYCEYYFLFSSMTKM